MGYTLFCSLLSGATKKNLFWRLPSPLLYFCSRYAPTTFITVLRIMRNLKSGSGSDENNRYRNVFINFPLKFIWYIINWTNIKIIIRQILYFLIWLFDFPTTFMGFPLTGSAIFYGSGSWQPKYFGSGSATLIFKSYVIVFIFCLTIYIIINQMFAL